MVVHDAVILPGHRMGIDLELIEHTAAFRRSFRIRKGARDKEASGPWKPIQLEEVRGVWRHCRELLIANEVDNSQYEYLRPRNLDRITELHESEGCFPEDKVFTLRVLGQQLDPNRGAVHTWLEETLPAPLSILQENPGKTSLEPFIGLAVSLAVNMGEALQRMERDYHTRLKGNSQAERRLLQQWFWHPLSEEFNRYLMALAKGIKEDPRGIAPLTASWANEVDRIAHEAHLRWVDNIPRRPADDLFSLAKCSIQFKRRTRDIRHDFNSSIETDHILLKQKNFQRISTPASIEVLQNRKIFIDGLYQLGIELDSGEPTRASRARRVLSRIRRSTNDPRYLPDLVELVLPHSPVPDEKEVWYFVAVLFSLNPRPALSGKRRPLGIAMRDSGTGSSVEARLRQLLTSDWNVLQYRLRQVVPMLQQQGVALDYGQLLDDLVELHQAPHGSARAHRVHLRWTEHFLSGWEDHHSTISAP
ncbi:CRISPR type I-E-associated protein CasB/Cse2 [Nocardiopsis sp. L17-MgMaSL7]|nr:CRISPR type I-E-associated protein CasB/Cse2 [Nocardiopsis sp. L17-MgMaSL7]